MSADFIKCARGHVALPHGETWRSVYTKSSSMTTANSCVRHEPNGVLQTSLAQHDQSIRQPAEQFGAIWFAQRDHDGAIVSRERKRNSMEKILVRGDKDGALL